MHTITKMTKHVPNLDFQDSFQPPRAPITIPLTIPQEANFEGLGRDPRSRGSRDSDFEGSSAFREMVHDEEQPEKRHDEKTCK